MLGRPSPVAVSGWFASTLRLRGAGRAARRPSTPMTGPTRRASRRVGPRPGRAAASTREVIMPNRVRAGATGFWNPSRIIEEFVPTAGHVTERYANNRVKADHGRLKARLRPMRGLKRLASARGISTDTPSYRTCDAATTSSPPTSTCMIGSASRSTNSRTASDGAASNNRASASSRDRQRNTARHASALGVVVALSHVVRPRGQRVDEPLASIRAKARPSGVVEGTAMPNAGRSRAIRCRRRLPSRLDLFCRRKFGYVQSSS